MVVFAVGNVPVTAMSTFPGALMDTSVLTATPLFPLLSWQSHADQKSACACKLQAEEAAPQLLPLQTPKRRSLIPKGSRILNSSLETCPTLATISYKNISVQRMLLES